VLRRGAGLAGIFETQIRKVPGTTWFQALFGIATMLSAVATFIVLSRSAPLAETPRTVQFLLFANALLIIILGWLVTDGYLKLRSRSAEAGEGQLGRRLMLVFGLFAMVPSGLVSLFLWASITQGIDTWFGQRVVILVEETASLARENVGEFSNVFEDDARLMSVDVNNAADGYLSDRERFESYLGIQAYLRNISAAFIVDRDGAVTAVADNIAETGFYRRPNEFSFQAVDQGEVVVSLQEDAGFASALIALDDIDGAYLYLAKPLDPIAFNRLRRADNALADYRIAKERSDQLKFLLVVAYFEIVALLLLLSVRVAQEVAARITVPIQRLAAAAREVSEGVRNVQVALPPNIDEVRTLSQSFNSMTKQLDERRTDLVTAREISESRRLFVETLLAELSAGVIRLDEDGMITLANRSAENLLGQSKLIDRKLIDVAPELTAKTLEISENDDVHEAQLELLGGQGSQFIQLKVVKDSIGGLVLTFDDATRLINAQRLLAWRDVARRIAHEIRNPLTPIQLSAERLRRRYADKLGEGDSVFNRCLDTIMRQVSDIGRMVQEFSDFARMPKPNPVKFDLVKLIGDICFAQQVVNPDYQISLSTEDPMIEVSGDERLLGQAFTNIIKNAAEALASRPPTDESQGQVQVAIARLSDTMVQIHIMDNGPGFPKDLKERLLEPYVSAREGGTGLGLAIVSRVIMDHGGQIELSAPESSHKNGAIVKIILPVQMKIQTSSNDQKLETTS